MSSSRAELQNGVNITVASERERVLVDAAKHAGDLQREWRERRLDYEYKGETDFVTEADLAVEDATRGRIQSAFPDDRVVGEERDAAGTGDWTWVLDPIDGTTNYYHGFDMFSVSIALFEDGEAVDVHRTRRVLSDNRLNIPAERRHLTRTSQR